MMSANITTETAAASPMRKYWKPYFSTSKPSTSVELAGPPGSVGSTYCRAKVWNALMEESAATSTAVERNCGRSICQKVRTGPAPSMAAASRNSGGMAARPASQIIMKNGMIAQSCTAIIENGASVASANHRISVTPHQPPVSEVSTPFECSNNRQTTAITTTGGKHRQEEGGFQKVSTAKCLVEHQGRQQRQHPDRHRRTQYENQRIAERLKEQAIGEEVGEIVQPDPGRRV